MGIHEFCVGKRVFSEAPGRVERNLELSKGNATSNFFGRKKTKGQSSRSAWGHEAEGGSQLEGEQSPPTLLIASRQLLFLSPSRWPSLAQD